MSDRHQQSAYGPGWVDEAEAYHREEVDVDEDYYRDPVSEEERVVEATAVAHEASPMDESVEALMVRVLRAALEAACIEPAGPLETSEKACIIGWGELTAAAYPDEDQP